MDFKKLETVMRRLAIEAGAVIMEIYDSGDLGVEAKDDDSPVTKADKAADALISAGLRSAFPDVALVTEEQAATHDVDAEQFLIVDPLDGTKEFVHRRGDFTVNIAFVDKGVPVRGVVYAPARGRLFYTRADGVTVEETGGFETDTPGATAPVTVSEPDNNALIAIASKSHRDASTDDYLRRLSVADAASAGSSLKFCLVACGEADFYPRLGRTMEWDTAAGQAVVLGAGGEVLRLDDLTPLGYGKPGFENPHFVVRSPKVRLYTA